jgi:hypothetical protein
MRLELTSLKSPVCVIEELEINGITMNKEMMDIITEAIKTATSLTRLFLYKCKLRTEYLL